MNRWNKFLQKHKNSGLNTRQLAVVYRQLKQTQRGGGIDVNINNCFGSNGCHTGNTISFVLPSGTFMFHGSRKDAQCFVTSKSGTEPIQFFNVEFGDTVRGYGGYDGKICVFKTNHDLTLYLQKNLADSTCEIFFTEDYHKPEAQCFCKAPFDGYATYFRKSIIDIGICSPEHKMTYLGYYLIHDLLQKNFQFYSPTGHKIPAPHNLMYGQVLEWNA
jgi:hypothetical protein